MNQEQNNLNPNNFSTQGNNGIPNNQPLNNQNFNQGMGFNQQPINPQPQTTPSYQQSINQMNMQQTTPQPMNNAFESGNANNQSLNSKSPKKMNLGLIIGIVSITLLVIIVAMVLLNNDKGNNNENNNISDEIIETIPSVNDSNEIISIGDEKFYIISKNNGTVKALAMYNLDINGGNHVYKGTGKQNKDVVGMNYNNTDSYYGTISFSNTDYWSWFNPENNTEGYYEQYNNTNQPYILDENSNIYEYLDAYKEYLSSLGKEVKVSLLSYEDAISLGCSIESYRCTNAPQWVYSTSYWLGSGSYYGLVWLIGSDGDFGTHPHNFEEMGIRPVISFDEN